MDNTTNKAITIAVGVFITIIITTGVLYVISNIKTIYSTVYRTDVGLQNEFYQFDEFENASKTGIDLLNAVKKYLNDNLVEIYIEGNNEIQNRYDEKTKDGSSLYKEYLSYRQNYTSYAQEPTQGNLDYVSYLTKLGEQKYTTTYETKEGFTKITFKKV